MQITRAATAAVVAALIGISAASAQNLPADLVQARADRRDAIIRGNAATFDKLTAPGYIGYDQMGRVETKAEYLARLKPPATPIQGPVPPPQRLNEHIAMYNNDTVVFFWQQKTAQGLGNFMETYVKEDGQWKCAASAFSPAAQPVTRGGRN